MNSYLTNFLSKIKETGYKDLRYTDWSMVYLGIKSGELTFEQNQFDFYISHYLEHQAPLYVLQLLFEKDPTYKNNSDYFKWACAYSSLDIVMFLEKEMDYKNIEGAITAAIVNQRASTFYYMMEQNYPIFTEQHFSQAIARSSQNITFLYYENMEKIEDLSEFSIERAKELLEKEDAKKIEVKFHQLKLEKELSMKSNLENKAKFKI